MSLYSDTKLNNGDINIYFYTSCHRYDYILSCEIFTLLSRKIITFATHTSISHSKISLITTLFKCNKNTFSVIMIFPNFIRASEIQLCIENGTRLDLELETDGTCSLQIVDKNMLIPHPFLFITLDEAHLNGTLSKTVVHSTESVGNIDVTDIFRLFSKNGCQLVGDVTVKNDGPKIHVIYQFTKPLFYSHSIDKVLPDIIFFGFFIFFLLGVICTTVIRQPTI